MIGRVLQRGKRVSGLLWYLYSRGKTCVHSHPHLVSGWRHPAELEPPVRENGKRDFRRLTGLLEQPLAGVGDRAPAKPVWHCTVRAAPGDPELGDGAWMRIAGEIMHRTGLSRYDEEGQGVRWVAVHHGENHIHIAAVAKSQLATVCFMQRAKKTSPASHSGSSTPHGIAQPERVSAP